MALMPRVVFSSQQRPTRVMRITPEVFDGVFELGSALVQGWLLRAGRF